MEQKAVMNISINCIPTATATKITDSDQGKRNKPRTKNRRRFRGHGWSSSKKARKLKKTKQNFSHYAVNIGRKGQKIYDNWDECARDVIEYNNADYKGFHSLLAAKDWLRDQQAKQSVRQLIQKHKAETRHATDDDDHDEVVPDLVPTAKAVPIQTVIPTATAVLVDPDPAPITRERDFAPVAELARLISNSPVNGLPSPPACTSKTCPYTCGEILHMQKILLFRLYQTTVFTAQHKDLGKDHKL